MEDGAFGLPWFVGESYLASLYPQARLTVVTATNTQGQTEGFWGFDHLGQVIEHLGLERGNDLRAML